LRASAARARAAARRAAFASSSFDAPTSGPPRQHQWSGSLPHRRPALTQPSPP
jgi:hypothetical protein